MEEGKFYICYSQAYPMIVIGRFVKYVNFKEFLLEDCTWWYDNGNKDLSQWFFEKRKSGTLNFDQRTFPTIIFPSDCVKILWDQPIHWVK